MIGPLIVNRLVKALNVLVDALSSLEVELLVLGEAVGTNSLHRIIQFISDHDRVAMIWLHKLLTLKCTFIAILYLTVDQWQV